MGQTCYCDNSPELWGKEIEGIRCISPSQLKEFDKLLVVTHMADDREVRQQLKGMGIEKIVNIKEIYKIL